MEISKSLLSKNKEVQLNIYIISLITILYDVDDYKIKHYNKDNPNQNLLNFLEPIKLINKIEIVLIKEILDVFLLRQKRQKLQKL